MAAALAKVLRGGCSGASSALVPAICRRGLQEGIAPLLPGSSRASAAAGIGRLMHTGQQKALPFGRHVVLSQEQKLMRMEQFGSKRLFSSGAGADLPWPVLGITCALSSAYMISYLVRSYRAKHNYSVSPDNDE